MDGRIAEDEGSGSRFDGFLLSIEEGRTLGGIRNVEATEILRRSQSSGYEAHERRLTEFARENGCWTELKTIRDHLKYLGSGAESDVFLDKDGRYVLKVVNYKASCETPLDFLNNRIALHNTLFPETVYELLGFTYSHEIDEEGFYFIIKQPFIDSKNPRPTQEEIDVFMKRKGLLICDAACFIDDYAISDLAPRNFVKNNDGKLYCIDPMILKKEEYMIKYGRKI